jgi:hypothetical protein
MSQFVVCLDNHDYPASLERGKLYPLVEDTEGGTLGMLRIIDESGESYLYPAQLFAAIAVPDAVAERLAA